LIDSKEISCGVILRNKKHLHLINWDTITTPKKIGGIGLVKANIKNKALLANLTWRLYNNTMASWAKVLINQYSNKASQRTPPSYGKILCMDKAFVIKA